MRCNTIDALIVGAFVFAQAANAQQIPPAPSQLKTPSAPGASSAAKTLDPVGVAPNGAPAAAGNAAAEAAIAAGSGSTAAPNVVTLGQVANSTAAPSASTPPIVPAIQGNSVLATGNNAKLLDSAGPRLADGEQRPKPPAISLVRLSYTDGDLRALLKIHGVSQYVEVGSKVKKLVVGSISDEGVCLVNSPSSKALGHTKKTKNAAPGCAQLISFQ